LAREFLAEHALRPIDGDRRYDAVSPLDGEETIEFYRTTKKEEDHHHHRRSSSSAAVVSYNPACHSREENSAMFRDTRESLSTHLMETSTSFFSQEFQEEIRNAAAAAADNGDDNNENRKPTLPRYAVKHLKPSLLQERPVPHKFAKAAMDLACEAEMMIGLQHPNIVRVRGWASGGPDNYRLGTHTAYFLILDRMVETLQDRIATWRHRFRQERSWVRKLSYLWARSKYAVAGRCFNLRRSKTVKTTAVARAGRKGKGESGSLGGRSSSSSKSFGCMNGSSSTSPESTTSTDPLLLERVKVAYDIACAVEYLHEKGIIYRDLKSTNVGFNVRDDVQIFDFGLARYLPNNKIKCSGGGGSVEDSTSPGEMPSPKEEGPPRTTVTQDATDGVVGGVSPPSTIQNVHDDEEEEEDVCYRMSHVGTRRYTAPEVDQRLPYGLKADVYSFGVVLWEIMSMSSATSKGRVVVVAAAPPDDGDNGPASAASKKNTTTVPPPSKKMSRRRRIMVPCCCWPRPVHDLVRSAMADNPADRPTMRRARETLEGVLVELTRPTEGTDTNHPYMARGDSGGGTMHLSKRQRRRSTFRLEAWTNEVMEGLLEEEGDDEFCIDEDDDDDDHGGVQKKKKKQQQNQKKRDNHQHHHHNHKNNNWEKSSLSSTNDAFEMKQLSQTSRISRSSSLGSHEG
jgi:serine/threonine protein kinase